ncbi:hypothetical protein AMJ71_07040 [candidate division TA06 bacterium SM1_40]|uniref:Uncharacterized protein n=2 Tax=Bacteria division TA06 TaxID=1156500 RepID=A0A0S8JHP7_UNCT6|nr:MAG: hypothetical protein AMJ82_01215 [candidate division TA06 bacterium SM23_40]KPL09201.1 MAG: hypothetical protein AMJ71_07040 [candidate division TA06 bacterium SM1_40]
MWIRLALLTFIFQLPVLAAVGASLVSPRGEETSLEIVTWNIEWFPREGEATVQAVRQLVEDLDIDLYAVQEIADTAAFRSLLYSLPGYDGFWSPDAYTWGDYQKTGLIWRADQIAVSGLTSLFVGDDYAFPRPPIQVYVTASDGENEFDFHLVVLHLKAGGGEDNEARRRAAIETLKAYLDAQRQTAVDPDVIVAGDWNDELDDPSWDNVFNLFLADSLNYSFMTAPLAGDTRWASYPSTGSLIDHLLIDEEASSAYEGGFTETLRLDDEYAAYHAVVSDHRPVMSVFPIFPGNEPNGGADTTAASPGVALSYPFPNPASQMVEGTFYLPTPGWATLNLYNVGGQRVSRLPSGYFSEGSHSYSFNVDALTSGVYFVILITEEHRYSRKTAIVK